MRARNRALVAGAVVSAIGGVMWALGLWPPWLVAIAAVVAVGAVIGNEGVWRSRKP